ncbi:MAG TPA: TetR family transcriptional regulator [Solirubrobacteraceae bacterium]|jgi:AcrR family transcriptional regulator|nr:TetR family transcriptional regulator [Solirubrobacteraceae bacterium]
MAFEGLRELKKRETRQRISNVATEMFLARGFESVTVTEVAAASGVSEKTVYNYFPTKESLVLDQIQGQVERLIGAVRDRARGVPPSAALVAALKEDSRRFYEMIPADQLPRIEEFSAMVRQTPALRAAWSEHRHRMVAALTQVLAGELQVDEATPEPLTAARALVGLVELLYDSRLRHASTGSGPREVQEQVDADIDRGARLLDTGMWSLQLMVEGRRSKDQIGEAAAVAEHARQQVMTALRGAKRSWKNARDEARTTGRDAAREVRLLAAQAAREAAREAREQARRDAQNRRRQ